MSHRLNDSLQNARLLLLLLIIALASSARAQVGELIWEDNFDDLDNWMVITGNGSWGWGNGEGEHYDEVNVRLELPFESLTQKCLVLKEQEVW